ncbi:MAG: DNA-directed RNA polymerase subunit A' [archaeon]|nr:MAG: DNA-directed RNA polymerase subunit A' [archaeon]
MRDIVSKQVKEIKFSLLSPEDIKKYTATKIITPELYDMDGYPVDGGLMDLRLGAITPGVRCRTCGGFMKECLGHFGFIELARPVLHIKFLPLIDLCLKATCQQCGRILLKEEDIKLKRVDKAKNAKKCPHCGAKKEKIKLEKPSSFYQGKKRIFPTEIRERLTNLKEEDLRVLGVNVETCRPEWAVLTLLLVPPVTARPSITLESGEKSEDDLTHKLSDIIRANQRLWENLNAGAPEVIIDDLWDLLQYHVTTFFDNGMSNVPPARHRSGQPLKTITERIKGKEGRIRHNLAGKRVNFSSRTVVSPDPFIEFNEVGIPPEVAKVLSVPERATSKNMDFLKKLVKKETYPGAVSISRPDEKRKRITEDLRDQLSDEIEVGYIVERHLQDKDIVLFNRQPSLHKMSLMGHFTRVLPSRTFRIHPGTCFPYNADFDGDEMNIHAPQTEEARAEAQRLLDVDTQLMSPKINANVFGCIDDSITGLYLLSLAEKINKREAAQLLAECGVDSEKISFSKEKLSGRDIISTMIPKVSFEIKNKSCKGKNCSHFNRCKKEACPYNGYFSIKNGKHISGAIDEDIVGVEKNSLIREVDKEFGRKIAMKFLRNVFLMGVLYLTKKGISMALSDVETGIDVEKEIEKINENLYKKSEEIIEKYNNKSLEILPGKTAEETREIKLLQTLNEIRPRASEIVEKNIKRDNPAYIMVLCGARGSLLFITQMSNVVGQQSLWAKRIDMGYTNRTLSFYKEGSLSPRSRGYIRSGFLRGLKPDEFFFTAVTGRDGLMDTGLRTPKSGYLSRRLINALQDIRVEYDRTVRDSNSNIIELKYGEDDVDVSKEHLKDSKIAPGEAVGVITAQSIGEPSMQMTLNVFHFSGISEMQVSVGLPRLIEIFDARKKPSTPSMEVYLDKDFNTEEGAKKVAARIKEITLSDISKEITIDFTNSRINVELDTGMLRNLKLTTDKVVKELQTKHLRVHKKDHSIIIKSKSEQDYKKVYRIKEKLKKTVITGVKGVTQVLPVKRETGYVILTAGSNLEDVLKIKGVSKTRTTTNNIHEATAVLGIEAARQTIINEAMRVVEKQGIDINPKHIKLVADAMTSSGKVKGVTRVGIVSDKASILARASFETPIKHFVNSAINGHSDRLVSVVENLILNQAVPVGTGLPGLLVKIRDKKALVRK